MENQLSTTLKLVRVARSVATSVERSLAQWHGIAVPDLELMLELQQAADHRLQLGHLAKLLEDTPSAVVRRIGPLERIGVVIRQRAPQDPRTTLVCLTETGDTLATDAAVTADGAASDTLDTRWSAAQQADLVRLLSTSDSSAD